MKKKYVAPSFGCVCMETSAVLINTSNTITGDAEEIMNKLECQLIVAGQGDNLSNEEAIKWLMTNKDGLNGRPNFWGGGYGETPTLVTGCHLVRSRSVAGVRECDDLTDNQPGDWPIGAWLTVTDLGGGRYQATLYRDSQCTQLYY